MGKEDPYSAVVAAFRKLQRSASSGAIEVGQRAHVGIRKKVKGISDAGARRRRRAETLDGMKTAIEVAGYKTRAVDLSRMVCLYHVSEIFGPAEARTLPARTLRAFCSTIARVPKDEEWHIKSKVEKGARHLFARAVVGELDAGQVKLELDELLGRKPRPPKPKPSPVRKVISAVAKLSVPEQRELYKALQKKFDKPTIPMPEPPGKVAEVRRAG